ncbi:ATPase AAA [Thermosporothrix hazakensis]|nr:ATPase AAA [Thermosporothrix sp. COM3]GCE47212.1 ATPase AAA [Thermosporothrix hazakensis]
MNVMHTNEHLADGQPDCFLCTLDRSSHAFHETQIEGRILSAQETSYQGERFATFFLDTGSRYIALHLSHSYYRSLVQALRERREAIRKAPLNLRAYHLPAEPEPIEQQGVSWYHYFGNQYSLAILEPDTLLNITDLNQAEYCPRQYLLQRLLPSPSSIEAIRGNLVHYCFKELLKEHDRNPDPGPALDILQQHLEEALKLYSIDIALAQFTPDALRAEVQPHLESLARWYESERTTLWDLATPSNGQQVRAETFLLAPEIGLRGRLDLFWQQGERQRLLELKTGGANGKLPKTAHRWQVLGYHALLAVRRDSKMKRALGTLLYSGTPGQAQTFGIPSTIRELQRVVETRNILVLHQISAIPSPPPERRCPRCSLRHECNTISSLLQWEPPDLTDDPLDAESPFPNVRINEERPFFAHYYHLLQLEGREAEKQQAQLWQAPVLERIERGVALRGLEPLGEARAEKDGWEQTFRCINTSELREGDEILLSDGDPIRGEVVSGTILRISAEEVTVWTRELIAHPHLIDRYSSDLVHTRTLQNLTRWLQVEPHLRDLVAGKVRPRFYERHVEGRPEFNIEQNLAVTRALQMRDYLLVHGPPGTGKTSVIAEIVRRLCAEGKRVLLAAFTNQAVDNILKRLEKEGFTDYIRLGHERSIDPQVQHRLLQTLVDDPASVHEVLQRMPVIASTTATWSSDKYGENGLHFDVAVIDEAGQLTIPAILGALRFAKRFILVGDEKQLPPLVQSQEAAELGLSESLFSQLKRLDDEYMQQAPQAISACVPLRVQYRMNKWISHFASRVFYQDQLVAAPEIANQRLRFTRKPEKLSEPEPAFVVPMLVPGHPLVFLDVPGNEDEHKISTTEAQAVRALVGGLLARGVAPQDIGIIAPYRAQVALLRRTLLQPDISYEWEGTPDISIDTVDRFQGGERPVIIISFATAREPARDTLRRDFLVDPHRLNVALTRAQQKLMLVGSVAALENLPIFNRLITYCRSMKTITPYHPS